MELGLIKHYRKRDLWFEIFKKWVFWESSNYRFLFCEWGMRCIFQSVRNTFTPASCYGIQIRPAVPHSSLVAAADAVFVSAFLKLWLPNLRKRPTEIYVIFSRLMSQSGHVILSVQQGFTCSFPLNGTGATHGDSVSACPTYGHFEMKPPRSPGVPARVPCHNTF